MRTPAEWYIFNWPSKKYFSQGASRGPSLRNPLLLFPALGFLLFSFDYSPRLWRG